MYCFACCVFILFKESGLKPATTCDQTTPRCSVGFYPALHHSRRRSRLVRVPGIRKRNANEYEGDGCHDHESEDIARVLEHAGQRHIEEVKRRRNQTEECFSRDQSRAISSDSWS